MEACRARPQTRVDASEQDLQVGRDEVFECSISCRGQIGRRRPDRRLRQVSASQDPMPRTRSMRTWVTNPGGGSGMFGKTTSGPR